MIAFKIGYVPVDQHAGYQFQHKQPFKNNRVMSSQCVSRASSRLVGQDRHTKTSKQLPRIMQHQSANVSI